MAADCDECCKIGDEFRVAQTSNSVRAVFIPCWIDLMVKLSQSLPAILNGPRNFFQAIRTRRNLVFKLDRALDVPLVVPDQAQNLRNRRVSLAEWRVRTVVHFAVFQM